jgi:hypothetical protein
VLIDPRGAELLFQIHRMESCLPDSRFVAAIVDRITFNARILETGTDIYLLRTSKTTRNRNRKPACNGAQVIATYWDAVWQNLIVLENGSMTSIVGPPGESTSIPGLIRGYPVACSSRCNASTSSTGTQTVEPGVPSPWCSDKSSTKRPRRSRM